MDANELSSLSLYRCLTDLGDFYPLSLQIDLDRFHSELDSCHYKWVIYNPRKPEYRRWGLSLTSLDGKSSGVPDLDSVHEFNKQNGTHYDEHSFSQKTPIWDHFKSIRQPLGDLSPFLGRSHLIKFGVCGGFPPHRDLGESFRLISFLSGSSDSLQLILGNRKVEFQNGPIYFLDTRKAHCIFNFSEEAIVLILNIKLTLDSIGLVHSNLQII